MPKKPKAPPFVMVRRDLLKDPEWKKLSSSAKVLYIYLRAKFNHKTLNEVTLAYSEMNGILGSKSMSRSFKELEQANFIEKIKQGGLYGGITSYKFKGQYRSFFYQQRFKL